jgi:hypothetical protein
MVSKDSSYLDISLPTALVIFCVAAIVLTWPLVTGLDRLVTDEGDPLLNAWILAWDAHATASFQPLFDANIFYPFKNTLAYSEHMISNALLVFPLLWAGAPPVLAHNLLMLGSFILSGLGMFLLVRHLTRSPGAALIAGMAYAFCPFRFAQMPHLQIMSSQWLPFVFLFLHRFTEEFRLRDALLFALFFAMQALACAYIALFTALAVGLYGLYALLTIREMRRLRSLWRLAVGGLAALAVILPFFLPFIRFGHDMGFERTLTETMMFSAQLKNWLAFPEANQLLGKLTQAFRTPEGVLYPGTVILVSAIILLLLRIQSRKQQQSGPSFAWFYTGLASLYFLFSFGPIIKLGSFEIKPGPYMLLYHGVPGFKGIRAPSRMGLFVVFALSIVAAYGLALLFRRIRNRTLGIGIVAGLCLLIGMENWGAPYPYKTVQPEAPACYQWLADQPADRALVELPMYVFDPQPHQTARYVFRSHHHWHPLLNGYSGFSPPSTRPMAYVMSRFPDEQSLTLLRSLEIPYVLVHKTRLRPRSWRHMQQRISSHTNDLAVAFESETDIIFAVNPTEPTSVPLKPLNRSEITVTANTGSGPSAVLDGNPETAWASQAPQKEDMAILFDLQQPRTITAIDLHFGQHTEDYPRHPALRLSVDGKEWSSVIEGNPMAHYARSLTDNPQQGIMRFQFPATRARYARIFLTAGHPIYWWSITEADVFEPRMHAN